MNGIGIKNKVSKRLESTESYSERMTYLMKTKTKTELRELALNFGIKIVFLNSSDEGRSIKELSS